MFKFMTDFDSFQASSSDYFPVVVLKNSEPEPSYLLAELCAFPAL